MDYQCQDQPPQWFDNYEPQETPEVVPLSEDKEWIKAKNELYTMFEAFAERMKQQREQEALFEAQREKEVQEPQLLAQKQEAQEELPPNSDFHQLIEETCGVNLCAEQKIEDGKYDARIA